MAGGTYKPTVVPDEIYLITLFGGLPCWDISDMDISIYGGFRGTETRRSDRNLGNTLYRTILSGDLNDNDAPYTDRPIRPHDYNHFWDLPQPYLDTKVDNARHIFVGVRSNITLDGLYLTKGWAGDDRLLDYNPMTEEEFLSYQGLTLGGGLFIQECNTILRNLTIDDCCVYGAYLTGLGGGIYANLCDISMEDVVITNCFSTDFPGGMFVANNGTSKTLTMNRVTVSNNQAHGCCNAFFDIPYSMKDCIWQNNYSIIACGNLQLLAQIPHTWSDRIENCVFDGNEGGWCSALDFINPEYDPEPGPNQYHIIPTGLTYVLNSKFLNNGAVYLSEPSRSCGAICNYRYKLHVEGCFFEENRGISCGAICNSEWYIDTPTVKQDVYIVIRNNIFSKNETILPELDYTRTGGCGALCFKTWANSEYDDNSITRPVPSFWGEVTDNKFFQNHASNHGGAMCLDSFEGTVKNNKFDNDTAVDSGSEIFMVESVTNDIIECNKFVAPVTPDTVVVAAPTFSQRLISPNASLNAKPNVTSRSDNIDDMMAKYYTVGSGKDGNFHPNMRTMISNMRRQAF